MIPAASAVPSAPCSLGERGALFTIVMYAEGGLLRAERELATAVVSMANGCVFCCSVHARRFVELTGEEAAMRRIWRRCARRGWMIWRYSTSSIPWRCSPMPTG